MMTGSTRSVFCPCSGVRSSGEFKEEPKFSLNSAAEWTRHRSFAWLMRSEEDSNPQRGLVDTVSYFDESEPSWDDHTYFKIVENSRGKVGYHIKIDGARLSLSEPSHSYLFPGASSNSNNTRGNSTRPSTLKGMGHSLWFGRRRIFRRRPLSYPELASYLLRGRLRQVLKSSLAWGLSRRRPVTEFLGGTALLRSRHGYRP